MKKFKAIVGLVIGFMCSYFVLRSFVGLLLPIFSGTYVFDVPENFYLKGITILILLHVLEVAVWVCIHAWGVVFVHNGLLALFGGQITNLSKYKSFGVISIYKNRENREFFIYCTLFFLFLVILQRVLRHI